MQSFDSNSFSPSNTESFLTIESVVKAYPKPDGSPFVVLDGINMTIGKQEYVSVIGHSGCGKSTLIRIVAGLEQATSGLVTLEGKAIRKPGAEAVIAQAKAEAQKIAAGQIAEIQQAAQVQREQAQAEIDKQKQSAFTALEPQVEALSRQILTKLLGAELVK